MKWHLLPKIEWRWAWRQTMKIAVPGLHPEWEILIAPVTVPVVLFLLAKYRGAGQARRSKSLWRSPVLRGTEEAVRIARQKLAMYLGNLFGSAN